MKTKANRAGQRGPSGWLALADARGSLERDLSLKEASGESLPRFEPLVFHFHIGMLMCCAPKTTDAGACKFTAVHSAAS